MKDWVVAGVDLVAAVAVADDEEVVEPAGHELTLVGARVRAQQGAGVDVVGVALAPAHVLLGHEQAVVVLGSCVFSESENSLQGFDFFT